jgi:ribonucleoside-diphosphate reductase alpha chain
VFPSASWALLILRRIIFPYTTALSITKGQVMNISRIFTVPNTPIVDSIKWKIVPVEIKEKDKIIYKSIGVEVPEHWSQTAAEILAHKYFRKSGVPSALVKLSQYDGKSKFAPSTAAENCVIQCETSAKQVFHRLAGHWAYTGLLHDYFDEATAEVFYDEVYYMLAMQIAAPNSPQWFNTGLWWAYGINGSDKNVSYTSGGIGDLVRQCSGTYEYPQTSACFILGIKDSLLGKDGILDTATKEAKIFKYGSGSGINYSSLRSKGSPLTNGGQSSGLMSFLKPFDSFAGCIKSGGTTRRAARMVIVDCDHPEAEDFVAWKAREETKVSALMSGAATTIANNPISKQVIIDITSTNYEGEAYNTVSGQNSNNSLRVTDSYMRTVEESLAKDFGTEHHKKARSLWDKLTTAAWMCGDPGLQFHDTINSWHTIPKVAEQRATNPCAEYSFIDNSSCNLASINLIKFVIPKNDFNSNQIRFDLEKFVHVCHIWSTILDISISMSSYPDEDVAANSINYRAIGLGYANLGGMLMSLGIPYDCDYSRRLTSLITSSMHVTSAKNSMKLADRLGAFLDFDIHREDVVKVMEKHYYSLSDNVQMGDVENDRTLSILHEYNTTMYESIIDGLKTGDGLRNAQLTLLAPTGTIGLVMDCSTTGIEPDFSLIKHKKLAGGGNLTIVNYLVEQSLIDLGYAANQVADILRHVAETGKIDIFCPHIKKTEIAIFACANDIHVDGHLGMMAAAQPFLSGAISKTVNLPSDATIKDVSVAYLRAWKLGLKCVAIYRNECKSSQPLTSSVKTKKENENENETVDINVKANRNIIAGQKQSSARYKLPSKRSGFRQKVRINGQTLYLSTGEYSDGKLGEIFLNFGRDGSTLRHLLDSLAVAMSIGLQHGVPLKEYVDAFIDTRAEPNGMVQGSDNVKMCSSVMDYIVRELNDSYGAREIESLPEIEETKPVIVSTVAVEPINIETTTLDDIEISVEEDTTLPNFIRKDSNKQVGLRTLARPRYIGNSCSSCSAFTLRRSGTCHVCDTCGETTGCS